MSRDQCSEPDDEMQHFGEANKFANGLQREVPVRVKN